MRNFKILGVLTLAMIIQHQVLSQSDYIYGNSYKLKVPDYMSKLNLDNEDASMQFGNIYKEVYFVVIDESKKEFIDIFTELLLYDIYDSPLNNFRLIQLEYLKEGIEITSVSKAIVFDANGKTGQIVELSGVMDGFDVYYVIGYVQGEEKLYQIVCWTLLEGKYKYKTDLMNIIKSFCEI